MCGERGQNESKEMNGHINGDDKGVEGARLTVCYWMRRGNDVEINENLRGDGGQVEEISCWEWEGKKMQRRLARKEKNLHIIRRQIRRVRQRRVAGM